MTQAHILDCAEQADAGQDTLRTESPRRKRSKKPSTILRWDHAMMGGDWRVWIGKKVSVKFKEARRRRWAHGYLQIIDYPDLCPDCGPTTAVITDRDGKVKWSCYPFVIPVGHNVTYLLSQQENVRKGLLGGH